MPFKEKSSLYKTNVSLALHLFKIQKSPLIYLVASPSPFSYYLFSFQKAMQILTVSPEAGHGKNTPDVYSVWYDIISIIARGHILQNILSNCIETANEPANKNRLAKNITQTFCTCLAILKGGLARSKYLGNNGITTPNIYFFARDDRHCDSG